MKQFKWKLFFSFLAVILALFLSTHIYLSDSLKKTLIDHASANLRSHTFLARTVLEHHFDSGSPPGEINRIIRQIAGDLQARVTIIDLEGRLLVDSTENLPIISRTENHFTRPEFMAALKDGFGASIRFSTALRKRMVYAAVLGKQAGRPAFVVRLALPLDSIEKPIMAAKRYLFAAASISIVLAFLLSLFVAQGLSKPLKEVTLAAKYIAAGNFDHKIYRIADGELGILAETLNLLSTEMRNRISDIMAEKKKNETILASMSDGIMAVDKAGTIILVNRTLENAFDIKGEIAGRTPVEVIRSINLQQAFSSVLKNGIPERIEITQTYPKERVFDISAVPLATAGAINGAIAVFHDVTEMKRLDQVRRDFVANVSHELKNPLTSIKGYTETLLECGPEDPDAVRPFLERIDQNAQRMINLINDVLALARLESGEATITDGVIRLRELIDSCINTVISQAGKKRIEFIRTLPAADLSIPGDFENLSEAVINILDNAIKYSPPGSRITVALQELENEVQLSFHDQGRGIPRQDLDRIFERFYRVDKGRARVDGGTGLGLSIAKHAVMVHKGRIWAESEIEHGSVFHIALPKGNMPPSTETTAG